MPSKTCLSAILPYKSSRLFCSSCVCVCVCVCTCAYSWEIWWNTQIISMRGKQVRSKKHQWIKVNRSLKHFLGFFCFFSFFVFFFPHMFMHLVLIIGRERDKYALFLMNFLLLMLFIWLLLLCSNRIFLCLIFVIFSPFYFYFFLCIDSCTWCSS